MKPDVSFIIPAWNEAAVIGATIDAINDAARALNITHEVVVADDDSDDDTATIARARGALAIHTANRQIAATRNAGADAAIADRFIFVDADTIVSPDAVRMALDALDNGADGGGTRTIRFDGKIPRWAALLLPVTMTLMRAAGITPGCFMFCARETFNDIGGYDENLYASEEAAFSKAIRARGRGKFKLIDANVLTSGRKLRTHSAREIWSFVLAAIRRPVSHVRKRENLDLWYGPRREDA